MHKLVLGRLGGDIDQESGKELVNERCGDCGGKLRFPIRVGRMALKRGSERVSRVTLARAREGMAR